MHAGVGCLWQQPTPQLRDALVQHSMGLQSKVPKWVGQSFREQIERTCGHVLAAGLQFAKFAQTADQTSQHMRKKKGISIEMGVVR